MYRTIALIVVITLALPIAAAFGNLAIPARPWTILPEDCELPVDGEMLLTLDGSITSEAVVSWDVDKGGISYVLPGREAVLVAPSIPTVITVTASISPAIPGLQPKITRQCSVTALNSAPNGLAGASGSDNLRGSQPRIQNSLLSPNSHG